MKSAHCALESKRYLASKKSREKGSKIVLRCKFFFLVTALTPSGGTFVKLSESAHPILKCIKQQGY